jgi:hypothetical protein
MVSVVLAALAAVVWASPTLRHEIARSVVRQPTPYTELYFSGEASLPKRLFVSRPNQFNFTIANHEGQTVQYRYVVTGESLEQSTTIAQTFVTVASGHQAEPSIGFTPLAPHTQYVISVKLLDRPESIHFRTTS